jgi:hypothetical protein
MEQDLPRVKDPVTGGYRMAMIVSGRIVMTNYDPDQLSNEERLRLNAWAEVSPTNELSVDIRPGYPGGEFPIHGKFRLRSLANVLNFLGRGIAEEPEQPVAPDPRTPPVAEKFHRHPGHSGNGWRAIRGRHQH